MEGGAVSLEVWYTIKTFVVVDLGLARLLTRRVVLFAPQQEENYSTICILGLLWLDLK